MLAERQRVKGHIEEQCLALVGIYHSYRNRSYFDLLLFVQTANNSGNTGIRAFLNKDNTHIGLKLLSLTCTERCKKTCVQK